MIKKKILVIYYFTNNYTTLSAIYFELQVLIFQLINVLYQIRICKKLSNQDKVFLKIVNFV